MADRRRCELSALIEELERYLTVRRSLGYDLRTSERVLRQFVVFAKRERADHTSADLFLRWQRTYGQANQQTWSRRLSMVRLFAQWLHGIDERHEVPAKDLIPGHYRRVPPHIYSNEEIRRIVETAAQLPSMNGIRALTFTTLFGLIAVTGLRVSEALSLDGADVDLETGVLMVRRGKLGKARLLPLSGSTTTRLATYAQRRDRLLGTPSHPFFVSDHGDRVTDCSARYNFATVCQIIGLRPAEKFYRHGHGPRIHDLRHTFAVRTLIEWYRAGRDPSREMIKLTTYLGHANPKHTYWYIEAVPELLELASQRAEASLAREEQRR
jgi:integrase/recombinase XerD